MTRGTPGWSRNVRSAATLSALQRGASGLAPCRFETVDLPTYVGEVPALDDVRLDHDLAHFDSRNNRLARLALRQDGFEAVVESAKARYGAARIGVFLGHDLDLLAGIRAGMQHGVGGQLADD